MAVASLILVKHPAPRVTPCGAYPALTLLDVIATANHSMLDVISALAVLILAYAIARLPALRHRPTAPASTPAGTGHGDPSRHRASRSVPSPGGRRAARHEPRCHGQEAPTIHQGSRRPGRSG